MQPPRQSHWDQRYQSSAPQSLTWFQENPVDSLALLARFSDGPGQTLIDIGTGNSRLPDALLDQGWQDITLFDISEMALGQTKTRLGDRHAQATYVQGDITAFTPHQRWDIWHDRAVFHFLTDQAEQDAYLAALDLGTTENALIILATFALSGPEKCSGLPVKRYSAEMLSDRLGSRYQLLDGFCVPHVTPSGNIQDFTFTAFRKRPA